jgi:ribonuclease D
MTGTWIRTAGELERLASELLQAGAVALDSESDSLYHHFEKVCLIQYATPRGDAGLIDPLALRDLSALGPVMSDPAIRKVLHGADYDVTTMKRDFDFTFRNLFDTMIAARFLGMPEVGLQAMLKAEMAVELSKDSQKDDWSRRPLTPRQEAYAVDDVRYLLELQRRLEARLSEAGRLAWVIEECEAVATLEPARRLKDPEGWLRIKGARQLTPRRQAILRELYAWRESIAESTDTPGFKILSPDTLVALAERQPLTVAELRQVRGVSPRLRAHGGAILESIARAMSLDEQRLPRVVSPPRPVVSADTRRRVEALRRWRAGEAARLGLDVSIVLPQRLLDRVAEASPRDRTALAAVEGLRRWRVETFGEAILDTTRRA